MNKLEILFASPATYTAIALFIVNSAAVILPELHGTLLTLFNLADVAATVILQVNHVSSAALTGSTQYGATIARTSI